MSLRQPSFVNQTDLSGNQAFLVSPPLQAVPPRDYLVTELLSQLNAVATHLKTRSVKPGARIADLGLAEHAVLEIVSRADALTVPQIARERATSRQNIQILIDRLEAEGRVELVQNPAHKRSPLVRLTEVGRNWLKVTEPNRQRLSTAIAEQVSTGELEAALAVLRKVDSLFSNGTGGEAPATGALFSGRKRGDGAVTPKAGTEQPESSPTEFPVNLL